MNLLKHIALAIAVHATLLVVAGDADPRLVVVEDATPFRTHTTAARTRLMQQDRMLRLEFQLPASGDAWVTLLNAQGRVLLREHIDGQGTHTRQVPAALNAQGPYTVRIEQDGITLLKKLVIEQA